MKKFLSLLLLFSMVLLSLTACMSDEEKQQAKENERLAKPVIERYVEKNYSGATVKDVECLTYTGGSVFPATYATDCVRAKVSYKLKTFNVVVNLETKEFYNDYYKQDIEKELKSLIYNGLSVEKPKDLEIKFADRTIWSYVSSAWGYLEADIDSAEELLASSDHKVYVVCKYAGSNMDFDAIPVKKFFKNEYKSDIELYFINYRSADRYMSGDEIDAGYGPVSFLNNPQEIYCIEEIKSASKLYTDNAFGEIDESVDFQEYEEEYVHNNSEVYNGVEFVWDDNAYDIDFSTVKAEPVVTTEHYSGEPFYAKRSNAIKLDCTRNIADKSEFNKSVYMFFDNNFREDYLITDDNGDVSVDRLYGTMNNRCLYEYVTLSDFSHEITLGIYRRAEDESR
ncbi:MAG: hypothetical protein UH080_05415 [Ruminococcus sp.]|nr:hypothetical protein [Ruminococcus sp.]